MKLLTVSNKKLLKSDEFGWMSVGLSLVPNIMNSKGINICGKESPSCVSGCLIYSGMNSMTINSKIKKTDDFLADRHGFLERVSAELIYYKQLAKIENKKLSCRLNMYSDINFANFKIGKSKINIYEHHPDIQFIEYTRFWNRNSNYKNLHYTYSVDRANVTDEDVINQCKQNKNVSVIYTGNLPKEYLGIECVDGDINDLRHLDKQGVVVMLKYKNAIKKGITNKELLKENTTVFNFE